MASSSSGSDLSPVPGPVKASSTAATPKKQVAGKKRVSAAADENATPSKKTKVDETTGNVPGIYCHQCRRKFDTDQVLRCTELKRTSKSGPLRRCNLAFCDGDLKRRFDISIADVKKAGHKGATPSHDQQAPYVFSCPCCQDKCQTSTCRKKQGLEPLGIVTTPNKLEVVRNREDGSSELSDVEPAAPAVKVKAAKSPKSTPAKSSTPAKAKAPKKGSAVKKQEAKSPAKLATNKKTAPTAKKGSKVDASKTKAKGKEKEKEKEKAKAKKPKPKPKAEKREIPVVPPPIFKRLDTKLNHEEGEQRIMLREYLVRFADVLSLNERSLAVLDDFDRPLTEASVRTFASAMLNAIHTATWGWDDEIDERDLEEIRHYADLARFAKLFEGFVEPYGLRMPHPPPAPKTDSTMKALLDLKEGQPTPQWATELAGPSRRVAASRIPPPAEIVRMLLALAERTLVTDFMRSALDKHMGEMDDRRRAYDAISAEDKDWHWKTKQMTAKSREGAKGKEALRRHQLTLAMIDVNLQARLSKRAARYEILGEDWDGRVYYKLSHRIVADTRATTPWANGLIVWGKGVQATEGDPPPEVERWSHFGTAAAVASLRDWLQYRTSAFFRASLDDNEDYSRRKSGGNTAREDRVEVVLPHRRRATSESTLSELSVDCRDELLSHLDPPGRQIGNSKKGLQGMELASRLHDVQKWLEVLEWQGIKGFGSD